MYIAVMKYDATIAALVDRHADGASFGHVVLKDDAGLIKGLVVLEDVWEFLLPLILFLHEDAGPELVESLGTVPLHTCARDINSIALVDARVSHAMEGMLSVMEDACRILAGLHGSPFAQAFNNLLERYLEREEEDVYAVS